MTYLELLTKFAAMVGLPPPKTISAEVTNAASRRFLALGNRVWVS